MKPECQCCSTTRPSDARLSQTAKHLLSHQITIRYINLPITCVSSPVSPEKLMGLEVAESAQLCYKQVCGANQGLSLAPPTGGARFL
jgi:hypothetical protein